MSIGWSSANTATGRRELEALIMSAAPSMVFCPHCWGDGRVWYPTHEGYVPLSCESCAGTGQVPS